ncbi:MAG: CPBP family intramembrane glutamic endopeptidase [Anaerolineales bacterium]
MRALLYFIALMLGALILSALLNYPLSLLAQELTDKGPHKLINTVAKLIAVPGFILIIRQFAINNKQALGYGLPRPLFIKEILRGYGSGLLVLVGLSIVLQLLDIRVFRPLADDWGLVLVKTAIAALIAGLLTGFIEETFFRGGLFGAIRKQHSFVVTMVLSSLFYATLHFIKPLPIPGDAPHGWLSGLQILWGAFDQMDDWRIFDSWLALFGLGALFALIRERTGNLAYCIGMHAAFVLVIKLMKKFTTVDHQYSLSALVGNYDGMIGYLSAAGLLIHTLIVYKHWRVPKTPRPVDPGKT